MRHCDVLIIGGGIIGCSIAYYTSKYGRDVTIIEKGEFVSGTSSRCDGNILAIDKDPGFDSQMSLVSQKLVTDLSEELEHSFEYRAPGSILVCESDEEMEAAQQWVNRQQEAGLPFRMLDRQDIREESPFFADDLLGGLECATDSTVNPYLLAFSLLSEAQKFGAKAFKQTEVKSMEIETDGSFVVETTNGTFTAKQVVNAAGVWAPKIGQMLNINIPIEPRKGHIIVASRQQHVGCRKVMEFGYLISKFGGKRKVDALTEKYGVALVFEPTESQNFLIGSSREFVGFHTRINNEVIKCIANRAIRFYPKMADMMVIRSYAGLRPWTEDHLPIISRVEHIPNYFIAAGHEGDGISLAAVTGKVIEELLNEKETIIPIEPLRLSRFTERVLNG
ncbi:MULTISPECIES: NAD(P)/FAD-dependent oxidoreductase [Bacillus]|uniref:Aerobic glycerol-3-phosphate dehydrogenase n=2 Tax=Bacillus cereus group TaxID=86661 RepID=A0A9X6KJ81_BACTU|nr:MULTISPECIES: FAD-dependent oxidoreductase [Bacillus]NIE90866.1 FAD-binding oxidoreductase [Bacillus sp. Ab-1751]AGE78720.1 Sarcosine oxidase, beta subunit [Bacillus thuringiensis serovar kurstaki str. HD73]AHZ51754.1 glycine oxidase [Bacillus thuringiensis serovar kurstaki str. YBT-1520]AIE34176.1 glycine oxidase [Bacillus thuringiensis serovar kurstaki str. HD-1]AJK38695.1 FAD dependent oxidoreductase family protein [Bacillus thuringiensis serovar kurstaki]